MKWYKRFNTVFYKLIFTYVLLIIISITLMGISSYAYFSSSFNSEIENVNERMLGYLRNTLDENVFKKTERIYLELFVPNYRNDELFLLFDESLNGNHMKIHNIYTYLQNVVSVNSSLLESIDVYYSKNDMIISSHSGLTYLNGENEFIGWVNIMKQSEGNLIWLTSNDSSNSHANAVSLVVGYPQGAAATDKSGYVAINIKANALSSLLSESSEQQSGGQIFIIDEDGIVAKSNNKELNYDLGKDFIKKTFFSTEESQSFIKDIDGVKSMVSYHTIGTTNWKLVNITPVEQFYSKSQTVQQSIIIIGIIAVLIGVVISHILTINMYNPVKILLNRTKSLFSDTTELQTTGKNEYHLIDNLIDNLSIKVKGLESTLRENIPMMRNKLAFDLLYGKVKSREELNERLNLLNMNIDSKDFFTVFSLTLNTEVMQSISLENRQFIVYNLISQTEKKFSEAGLLCLAIESAEDHQIDVIVGAKKKNSKILYDNINHLSSYAHSNFSLELLATIGQWKESPLLVDDSFRELKALMKYQYFFPENKILSNVRLLKREQSKEKINDQFLDNFNKTLRTRNIEKVNETLSTILFEIKTGNYAADYCHQILYDLVYNYYKFIKELNYSTREILNQQIYDVFNQLSTIDEYKSWLLNVIESSYHYLEEVDKGKNNDIIDKVKNYIIENLPEDLSLNAVADVVHLSPRYLSRIFKQSTGENFVDFVTKERMKAAKEMVVASDQNIESISLQFGYNNPAYFTKKFKETYGVTPSFYRTNYQSIK
ncbi:AraC family transcriptional regulator [Bacillus solitudinis]|uniref:AraC family transcriptional regulator n=1 Tax=Bacillus solitudinis TaxID=2014074 RepID=UPI000C23C943|nr:helix-turn-helix domain-containing protein [Bacillus solitudinis]